MRIMNYEQAGRMVGVDDLRKCYEHAREIVREYSLNKSRLDGVGFSTTYQQLAHILAVLKFLPQGNFDVRDKTILDLGCGSSNSPDGKDYSPHLKRILHDMGANIVGFDLRKDDYEAFPPTFTGDLTRPDSLRVVRDNVV